MTADWPTIDPSDEGGNPSDLFGGDLFGEELLDMYNTSAAPMSNILLSETGCDEQQLNRGHPAMDYDGLGAFRPSNSINDFTSILENNNTVLPSPAKVIPTKEEENMTTVPAVVDNDATNNVEAGNKRSLDMSTAAPSTNPQPLKKKVVTSTPQVPVAPTTVVQHRVVSTEIEQLPSTLLTSNDTIAAKTVDENAQSTALSNSPSTVATTHSDQVTLAVNVAPVPVITKSTPTVIPAQPSTPKGNHIVANAAKVVPSMQSKEKCGSAKTEESFKGVAQAAVTNLILSAGNNGQRPKEDSGSFVKPIDTSTAHVAALTSNNWVAACAASISGAPPGTAQAAQAAALAAASDPAAAKAARARRATLTADERARQNRDRNREHARNTRLRKKAYVEELKRTLTELVTQRDAADVEKRHEKQRDLEVREVRYRVMEEFLKLRARGAEQNLLARWVAILEDGFTLTLPKTQYRAMVPQAHLSSSRRVSSGDAGSAFEVDTSKQVLHNANQCFDDASKVASFVSSVLMRNGLHMSYHCERTHFMMDGVKAVLDWTLKAAPLSQNGEAVVPCFSVKGCMRATFSPASNKLASAELMFDTGEVISQVKALKSQQTLCPIEETGALLDSVLPHGPTSTDTVAATAGASHVSHPSSVSVVSTEKDSCSDEEGVVVMKAEPQTA